MGGVLLYPPVSESVGNSQGQAYYRNVVTDETTWEAPDEPDEDTGLDPGRCMYPECCPSLPWFVVLYCPTRCFAWAVSGHFFKAVRSVHLPV